jgi:hypothetical protein
MRWQTFDCRIGGAETLLNCRNCNANLNGGEPCQLFYQTATGGAPWLVGLKNTTTMDLRSGQRSMRSPGPMAQ